MTAKKSSRNKPVLKVLKTSASLNASKKYAAPVAENSATHHETHNHELIVNNAHNSSKNYSWRNYTNYIAGILSIIVIVIIVLIVANYTPGHNAANTVNTYSDSAGQAHINTGASEKWTSPGMNRRFFEVEPTAYAYNRP
jgi:hypothetical protein